MIINKLDIREQNEATVLKAIIENKNISRANISTLTNLNKASVSQIIKNLIENDIVEEVGIGNASSMGGENRFSCTLMDAADWRLLLMWAITMWQGCWLISMGK